MKNRKALVCGLSGQDGSYLAHLLLEKGYTVVGTSRDIKKCTFENIEQLGIRDRIVCEPMVPTELDSVREVLHKVRPDEIYNFSGQSSLGLSFREPLETIESHVLSTLNLLESMRILELDARFFNASSGECFGSASGEQPCNENTCFKPGNPYAAAKAASFWEVASYRDTFGLFACSGILFNHESHLRGLNFVSRKITHSAARIKLGLQDEIELGNLNAKRDWGSAEDYVRAMWLMLQGDEPDDYVIASGRLHSVRSFVESAFETVGFSIAWQGEGVNETGVDQNGVVRVRVSEAFFRPVDAGVLFGDPGKARANLDWQCENSFESMVQKMVEADLKQLKAAEH